MIQLEKVDPLYYARSSRLDIAEETRLLADAPTAKAFREAHREGWLTLSFMMSPPTASLRTRTKFPIRHILSCECILPLRPRHHNSDT